MTVDYVRWHTDDQAEWLGWLSHQDMRKDNPTYSVRSPEPGVWAGWLISPDGDQQCVTLDYVHASEARDAVQGVVRS